MARGGEKKPTNGRRELPGIEAYSNAAIGRAVRTESLLHPLTLYPVTLGLVSGLGALLFHAPLFLAAMGGLLGLGGATAIVNFFFRDRAIARRYLDRLSTEHARHREGLLAELKQDLSRAAKLADVDGHGVQGREQLQRIGKKYEQLRDLLDRKLHRNELTYGRFLGAAEQVQLSVLDNLIQIAALLASASSIDLAYIEGRLAALRGLTEVDEADEREFETLNKRLALREPQLDRVNSLLTANEESMTAMDETIAAVTAMQTGDKLATVDLETSMQHLRELIAHRTREQILADGPPDDVSIPTTVPKKQAVTKATAP